MPERILIYSDIAGQLELLFRTMVACMLGCLIGYERRNRDKSAGMRTHAIVCLGAALMMIVSKYCFFDVADYDASRVAAQIVSGVGFLGTGMIFKKNDVVSGLTTAAGVWTTAGIGMAIGAGAYLLGVSAGLLMIIAQIILHRVAFLSIESVKSCVTVTTDHYENVLQEMREELKEKNIKLIDYKAGKEGGDVKIEMSLLFHSVDIKNNFVIRWSQDPRVKEISG